MGARRIGSPRLGFVLVGLLLVGANLRASITAVGPVLLQIRADLGLSAAAAGVLASLPVIAFGVCSPMAPPIARRFGLERTLWLAVVVLALGIILRSVPVVGALWAGTALLGAAIGFMNVLLPSVVKRDFRRRVGSVTGAYSVAQSITAAVASVIAVPLAGQAQDGWRLAIGVWAGLAIIAAAMLLPRLLERPAADAAPEAQSPSPSNLPPEPRLPSGSQLWRSPWRSPIAWQVTVFMGLQSLLFYVIINWLPAIEQSLGVSAAAAGFHLFVFQLMNMAGNILTATLLHRMRDQRLLGAASSLLALVGIAGILVVPQLLLVWVSLVGVGAGSSIVLALAMFGLRTRHHRQTASLSGMAQSLGYLLAASGPIMIGALHDGTGSWTVPLFVLCGLLVVQTFFGLLAGRARTIP